MSGQADTSQPRGKKGTGTSLGFASGGKKGTGTSLGFASRGKKGTGTLLRFASLGASPLLGRFRGNRLAWGGVLYLAGITVLTIVLLPFSVSWYDVQDVDVAVRHAPTAGTVVGYDSYQRSLDDNRLGRPVAALGPAVHGAASWWGYDAVGRSLLFRCLLGFLVSLVIGLGAAGLSVTIGVLWGASAALAGGWVDAVLMRIVDVLFGLPYILMVILLKVALERPLVTLLGGQSQSANVVILVVAIGAVSWLTMARVIRGQVLSLREQPFIEAARALGAGPLRIMFRHLLPNLMGPIAVYATLVVPQAILQESFLSFLGIGVQQPIPSLGGLAADGVQAVNTFVGYWWLISFPCALLVTTLLALNFVGDGLRDAFDPKSRVAQLV